jgi:hypothetical protein
LVVLPAVRDLRINAQMKPFKLFDFGTYRWIHSPWEFCLSCGYPGHCAQARSRTIYLTLYHRTFWFKFSWPTKPERINGVPL